jgi:hypothetical protein
MQSITQPFMATGYKIVPAFQDEKPEFACKREEIG